MIRRSAIAALLLAVVVSACSKKGGGNVKLRNDTDSVAYVIGMNIGMNLHAMDSTINAAAVCDGIRDALAGQTKLTTEEARNYYLRYMNYTLPEKARAYEEQFLADIAKSNRSYARTTSGVTYTVAEVGDQNLVPTSDRRCREILLLCPRRYAAQRFGRSAPGRARGAEAGRQGRPRRCVASGRCGLWRRRKGRMGHRTQCDAPI